MEHLVSFGERIREERERMRLNQTAFAATGGVTKKTQMLYEAGERFPDVRYLAAVHEIGCDVRYIVTGNRDAPPPETFTQDERELIASYRSAPLVGKMAVVGALKGAIGADQPERFEGSMQIFHQAPTGDIAGRDIVKKGGK